MADSGFTGILFGNCSQRCLCIFYLSFFQTAFFKTLWNKIFLCNFVFFLINVAAKLNNFGTVKKRRRYRVQSICCKNKKYIRNIKWQVKVSVAERSILLRVQNFKESRSRVAPEVASYLVYLVKEEQRIVRAALRDAVDDSARNGAYVCAPVTSDLGLVPYSAQTQSPSSLYCI